ncbi:MAG: feruloyl-CoA synthase [Pseudomonadota bacterium]|nr:feruloyl-CoA synthase [Pseudomonadota bacterium]
MGVHLVRWAREAPQRDFLLERAAGGAWQAVTYGKALEEVQLIAGGLLSMRLTPAAPIVILSENSVQHALLMLAAMHVGIPIVPVSPAYSLVSRDFAKLKSIIERVAPAIIYVESVTRYAAALIAIKDLHSAAIVAGAAEAGSSIPAISFQDLYCENARHAVAGAFAAVTPDTVAKVLFTSGSTDEPKGVINTQRMLCSNQQAKAQVWPFLEQTPPILVDWLPWNHTFGGNHNFNLVLRNGGTLYIDAGRPVAALWLQTVVNLREIAPTIYFNVPRGFELLIGELRTDRQLRRRFFSKLQVIFCAAAPLPQHLWDALLELCRQAHRQNIPVVSAWGSTETSPLVTDCHFQADRTGVIGLPVPGCELKLLASGDKTEIRVRGDNVFPGYWGQPELSARQFDEDGFYRIGDAVKFADESKPERGLVFDGRLSEDFKLLTGTWVNVGNLRTRAMTALAPLAQDIVVAGHEQRDISLLIFPNAAACRAHCADLPPNAGLPRVLAHPRVRGHIANGLALLWREMPASSTSAARALLLEEAPSIDAGEITDKGYINQRAVLARRKAAVDMLLEAKDAAIISLSVDS